VFGQSDSPGNEQREFWSSEAAKREGSRNLIGIQDPAVDALVEKIIEAPDRASLVTACRALDRVLQWGHYVVPNWHLAKQRIALLGPLRPPEVVPAPACSSTPGGGTGEGRRARAQGRPARPDGSRGARMRSWAPTSSAACCS
jgi:hypothetical protein